MGHIVASGSALLLALGLLAPADVPQGSDVFLPLIPKIADAVAGRLSRSGVTFHRPR